MIMINIMTVVHEFPCTDAARNVTIMCVYNVVILSRVKLQFGHRNCK